MCCDMPVMSTSGRDLQKGAMAESLSSLSTIVNTSSIRSSCSPRLARA